MAKNTNVAYSTFANKNAVTLEVDGVGTFVMSEFSGSWAINTVPMAQVAIALGRSARNPKQSAKIHSAAKSMRTMRKAIVRVQIKGQQTPGGEAWPDETRVLFEGYYVGYGYQKAHGQVKLVLTLLHWLADLGFSSFISSMTHPAIASSLSDRAVFQSTLQQGTTGSGTGADSEDGTISVGIASNQVVFMPDHVGHGEVTAEMPDDLWASLKHYMCAISRWTGFKPIFEDPGVSSCGGAETLSLLGHNERATRALARIEGPEGSCQGTSVKNINYKYGVPLKFNIPAEMVPAVSRAVCWLPLNGMVHQTMWDVLIGYFCPMFGLDLCPAIDYAVVRPSLPGWRGNNGKYWRTLAPSEYDYVDDTVELPKPLRGVVIHGAALFEGNANINETGKGGNVAFSGFFAAKGNDAADGAILYQPIPQWLSQVPFASFNGGTSTGTIDDSAVNNGPGAGAGQANKEPTPRDLIPESRKMIDCYARCVYIQNSLRGRSGIVSGRLRFDIAPGSHVKIAGSPEKFIGGEDELAADKFGQVTRVTVEINAESRRACTSLQLTHTRNDAENADDRTSIADHPFFPNCMSDGGQPLFNDPEPEGLVGEPSEVPNNPGAEPPVA